MSSRIGIIAEDKSDADVLEAIIRKARPGLRFGIARFLGRGCGKIHSKCRAWAEQLCCRGCDELILLHDLDRANINILRQELIKALSPCAMKAYVVVIPVREVEAWLLSDVAAIRSAMNIRKQIPIVSNPEADPDPKRTLGQLIYRFSGKTKRYLNTVHNSHIAAKLTLSEVRRCKSFLPLEAFLKQRVS